MVTPSVATENLTKSYGRRTVIDSVTFSVNPGEVYALVGPNGAGKTTIIRLVTGLAFPTSGHVYILGEDPHKRPAVRADLGAVVEAPAAFYPYFTGRANLQMHAKLAGGVPEGRIDEALELLELQDAADRKVQVYSLGMRQRLGVAAAILTKPRVLILDEPASGMDPLSLHLVHTVLRKAAEVGTAVLLSTHHLDEVVAYCSRVAILEHGRIIDEVNLLDRRERFRARVTNPLEAVKVLEEHPQVVRHVTLRGADVVFIPTAAEALGHVSAVLAAAGIGLLRLDRDVFDLRTYYRERVREADAQYSARQDVNVQSVVEVRRGGRRDQDGRSGWGS